ncbi:MAG: YafY family protein [Flavobacteriales bacterium]
MTQLARIITILTLLKSKRLVTATELADKFEVSVRTIYRDIRKLEESGVPVITIEGKGYSLMDGYTVAPVQFTEKQANALITARHLVKQSNDASFTQNFEEALTKISSVFRDSIQVQSEFLDSKIHVFDWNLEKVSSNVLSEIQLAIINLNQIEINYRKADDPNITFRKIEPCAIFSSVNKWILIAWCHLRNDYRAFRIDRIQHFKILNEKFEDRKFTIEKYFEYCREQGKKP